MTLNKLVIDWRSIMGRKRKSVENIGQKKTLSINYIQVLEAEDLFLERKEAVQELIVKMVLLSSKRGRPSKNEDKEVPYAA
ncbi:MAG TPA: hypothetical protein VNJ01_09220 [Bacteriovoracaceae bacterium]|nr:hypothetical protein [Bacteriovoracaceae bacterium]